MVEPQKSENGSQLSGSERAWMLCREAGVEEMGENIRYLSDFIIIIIHPSRLSWQIVLM